MNQKFPKTEKLKSSKAIASLFAEGKSYTKYPIKVFFLPKAHISSAVGKLDKNLAAFAVPKRNFKSAVDRNRIKRQLREAYRLNKYVLEDIEDNKIMMLFLYLAKDKPTYDALEKAMLKLVRKLASEMEQNKR